MHHLCACGCTVTSKLQVHSLAFLFFKIFLEAAWFTHILYILEHSMKKSHGTDAWLTLTPGVDEWHLNTNLDGYSLIIQPRVFQYQRTWYVSDKTAGEWKYVAAHSHDGLNIKQQTNFCICSYIFTYIKSVGYSSPLKWFRHIWKQI